MSGIIDASERFLDDTPCKFSEVICLKCLHRQISIRPVGTLLKQLQCAGCGAQGYIIETGKELEVEYDEE